ncbi:peptidyl-glycine alpha-amidating monooxygenase B-like isoform X2 [Daphnia pulicaria]|uniref:peptidyl-glycine alpha-amidating monooxygenase B-like isoform X2 n=1 Tax=Daphnia pulicaria TaxID=35523 RepID=UPI001EE9F9D9|nr:peptidyl-glycine alpha-amidating monooxygenase B-like isoform X2 [Daphnia pulicaria]
MERVLVLAMVFCACNGLIRKLPVGEPTTNGGSNIKLRMPGIIPQKNDDYLCTAFDARDEQLYITQYKIEGSAERAHHMLLYGCSDVPSTEMSWDCGHHGVCSGSSSIMFAWAKNAPPTSLPPSVGFRFGGTQTSVKYLVLQIHYAHTLPPGEKDYSGMDIDVTSEEQKYIAGIFLLIGGAVIPPFMPKVHADACCTVNVPAPLHLFAYRTHAHALGRVITGYKLGQMNGQIEEIARGNPQWPQAFYGMPHVFDLESGDIIAARCTYDSTSKNETTYMGSTAGDEMCNLYLMYYTDAKIGTSYQICTDQCSRVPTLFPLDSDEPLPPNPLLEEHALHGSHGQENGTVVISNKMSINLEQLEYNNVFGTTGDPHKTIPEPEKKDQMEYLANHGGHRKPGSLLPAQDDQFSNHVEEITQTHFETKTTLRPEITQIKTYSDKYVADSKWLSTIQSQPSAVAIDSMGNIVVFHRADRAWGFNTFGFDNRLADPSIGPIEEATIILFDHIDSQVINKGGQKMFYLPHGLTIDDDDCLWVTDVGAHQVFKLTPLRKNTNGLQILLELGKKLEPGSGDGEFCKPTSVAVLPSGEFFVADGYCNSRVIKYTKAGIKISEWKAGTTSPMSVPHSLTLVPEREMVCVADRENGRIQCFSINDGRLQMILKFPEFRTSLYAVAYTGGNMYAVNGPSSSNGKAVPAEGFIIDMKGSGEIVSVFGSKASTHLGTPHALALGPNGSSIYIADISPYRVLKLIPEAVGMASNLIKTKESIQNPASKSSSIEHLIDLDVSSFSTSMIILSILAVPLLVIIIVVSIIRLRQRGCCSDSKRTAKLDLGSLLGHRDPIRGGFEKLAMEDSDGEGELDSDSDADVVEFTKASA